MRTAGATGPGATCRPAPAAPSRRRRTTCGARAQPRARCSLLPPPPAGTGATSPLALMRSEAPDMTPTAQVRLKDPKDWKLIGTRQRRLDVPDKVTGKPIYGLADHLRGMLL